MDGVLPYNRSVTPAQIEEERRLLYVAMSRAKDQLQLYVPRRLFLPYHAGGRRFLGGVAFDVTVLEFDGDELAVLADGHHRFLLEGQTVVWLWWHRLFVGERSE